MDEVTRALWNSYSQEGKGDFFSAYVYMKYIDHFIYHALKASGLSPKEREETPQEDIDALLESAVQRVAEASLSNDTSIYHGKVVKVQDAVKLVTQKSDITVPVPERVVPFKVARDIVLNNPQSIALGTCACRASSPNPCLPPPMECCLIIGDPYASFIAEKSPLFRKASQEEAVDVIEAAHKRGDVQAAFFKKDIGNRFFAICNCCSCCCLGIKMWNALGGAVPILASSGYVAAVGEDCNGCGSCESVCRFNALTMGEQEAAIDQTKCMGCGVCVDICPVNAISFKLDKSKGEPLDLDLLKKKA